MLESISWGDYFTVLLCVAFAYYVAVILLFYRTELLAFVQRKNTASGKALENGATSTTVKDQAFEGLEETITNLRGILERAGKGASKSELLGELGQGLANYAGLRHPAFRTAINNYVTGHARELCGLDFSTGELEEHWKTLFP